MTQPLPPTDPSATDDKLPGEAELAALYRQLPRNEPGAALDAAVLRAAAQALQGSDDHATIERREKARVSGEPVHPEFHSSATASPGRSIKSAARPRRRHVPHWLVGLGSAASLVLVAGLAWHMRTTSMQEPAQAGRATAASEAAVSLPPIRQVGDTTNAKPVEDVANQARGQLTLGDTLGSVAAPTVSEGAASGAPAKIPSRLRSAERASDKARDERSSAPAAQIAPPPVAPSPASPLQEISTRPIAVAAPARAAPPSAAIAAKTSVSTAVDASDTPEQELDKIQRLFMHGHGDEARQRLRDFRQAHPDWPLPPALRAQQTEP